MIISYFEILEMFDHILSLKDNKEDKKSVEYECTKSVQEKDSNENTVKEESFCLYPLFYKEFKIGDHFTGVCTETKLRVNFAVIGYDRLNAKINLAILSSTFPVKWIIQDNGHKRNIGYASIIVDLWDKGIEILEYHKD